MDLKFFFSIFFIIVGLIECVQYVDNQETFELLKRIRPAKSNATVKAKTITSTRKIEVTFRKKKQNLITKKIVTIKP